MVMYKRTLDLGTVQRLSDGAFIPIGSDNRDSLEYQAWCARGNKPDEAEDLGTQKARYKLDISAAAEGARLRFITPGSGKAMAYQEKAKEAKDFLADPLAGEEGHAAGLYPLIYAEVGITMPDAHGVATVIAGRYEAFKTIEGQIARTEAAAQKRVKEAPDLATILATIDSLSWPSPEEA
jgi:hypothetical protein